MWVERQLKTICRLVLAIVAWARHVLQRVHNREIRVTEMAAEKLPAQLASSSDISKYLERYVAAYISEYERFTAPPPKGGGYPKFPISPYLNAARLKCMVLNDGVVIFDSKTSPEYQWWKSGGAALKIDYEPTVTPDRVTQLLEELAEQGTKLGIYRIVSKEKLEEAVWEGTVGEPIDATTQKVAGDRCIQIDSYDLSLSDAIARLTYGAFCRVLDFKLPDNSSDFWGPQIIRQLGFFPADENSQTFYDYFEVLVHREKAAWDCRNIRVRVKADVRRDFGQYISRRPEGGGTISFGSDDWIGEFNTVLDNLQQAIDGLQDLLHQQATETEDIFHSYLEENPILLDAYGVCESKPKFKYPAGEKSPIGKVHVEPDFIISYRDRSYKLIEIERPSKGMATRKSHPRQDFNQAAFQTGEWLHYIKNHYSEIKDRFPGIATKHKTAVIMSRSNQQSFASHEDMNSYIELMLEMSNVDEIWTYDQLLERAREVHNKLVSLGVT